MEDSEQDKFEKFWKNIEPTITQVSGTAELRVIRYAVKLGYEAGRQTLLKDLFDFLKASANGQFLREAPKLEPA